MTKAILAPILALSILFGSVNLIPSSWVLDVWMLKYDKETHSVVFGREIPFNSLDGKWYTQVVNQDRVPVCGWLSSTNETTGNGDFNFASREDDSKYPQTIPLEIWVGDHECKLKKDEIYQLRAKWVAKFLATTYTITEESEWFIVNK